MIYIGQSINLRKRKNAHFNALRKNSHENSKLQKAFDAHGEESFEYEVLVDDDSLTSDELDKLEEFYIRIFNAMDRYVGYNLCIGGKGSRGWKATEEQRLRRSSQVIGESNPFYGKKVSPENRKKMTEGVRRVTQTKEYREKMSEAMKGRTFTKEHSENKSNAQRGGKNPVARKASVEGIVYDTIQEVADKYGLRHNTTRARIKSKSERFKDWFYI